MNRLLKKHATVADVAGKCVLACKNLVKLGSTPGIQYKDQCKQLLKFAKSLLIPLEDLSDNIYADSQVEVNAAAALMKVCLLAETAVSLTCNVSS